MLFEHFGQMCPVIAKRFGHLINGELLMILGRDPSLGLPYASLDIRHVIGV